MEFVHIERATTFFHNSFLQDYYFSSKFDKLRTYKPKIEEINKAIQEKQSFSQEQRRLLVSDLKRQYSEADISIDGRLLENIDSLLLENSFTITTGQQIHIGLGPLYVLYKVFDAITIAKECKERYPKNNFVPVFWMATEDHDLEEISEINLFGKKLKWKTNQIGAVGRMSPSGLGSLFENIEESFNLSSDQQNFISRCKDIYTSSQNLSIAFRRLLHEYFGDTGIVILDADSKVLKDSFSKVLRDELNHKNVESLEASTQAFEKTGYDRQLVIRECNLFDLSHGDRVKITTTIENGTQEFVKNHALDLSPNAALRPFYQEWILPNLVYIGGASELKYWMQLKGIFDNYKMPMPLLHLRTSNIVVPLKQVKLIKSENLFQLFLSKESLAKKYSQEISDLSSTIDTKYAEIGEALNSYKLLVESSFASFSLEGKVNKISPKLNELRELTNGQLEMKIENQQELNKLLKIKDKYFNHDNIQERNEHVLAHIYLLKDTLGSISSHFGFKYSQKIGLLLT